MSETTPEVPRRGLPPEAYETIPGEEYPPYVPPDSEMAEFTLKAGIIGVVLGVVFGAANAYLGLRVGLTVSASIPAAVMAVAAFKLFKRGTILEANMVQTIGSAGESLAAGVIFTLPALFVWQRQDPSVVVDVTQITVIALFGGLLGVLFMIPLRSYLISREHGKLPYPEGTACAEVQVAGDVGGSKAKLLFQGLGLGALYQALANGRGFGLWEESPSFPLPRKAEIGGDMTPELLGVGFIIGPRIAAIMFGGGALAWLVLIPMIDAWGGARVVYPATTPMADLASAEIWNNYIRYVGAGAVGFAGIVTLLKSLPTIAESFRLGLGNIGEGAGAGAVLRTQRDLPFGLVITLAGLTAVALWLWPGVPVNFLGGILIVLFSFFFVTVSSRIVGLIGSSSNPVSGMTIAALILTSLIWVGLGLNDGSVGSKVAVLAVGAVVCISAAIAGDTSQDLKTGFLLGATPARQQVGEMIGTVSAALVMGSVLIVLNESYGIGTADGLPAPQATLMSLVIDGVLNASLPWGFVIVGVVIAAVVEFVFKLPSLAFAVGLYLPVSLTTPIMIGGLMRWALQKRWASGGHADEAEPAASGMEEEPEATGVSPAGSATPDPVMAEKREQGVLFASGLIAGAALVGVLIGGVIYGVTQVTGDPSRAEGWIVGHGWSEGWFPFSGAVVGLIPFTLLCLALWWSANREIVEA